MDDRFERMHPLCKETGKRKRWKYAHVGALCWEKSAYLTYVAYSEEKQVIESSLYVLQGDTCAVKVQYCCTGHKRARSTEHVAHFASVYISLLLWCTTWQRIPGCIQAGSRLASHHMHVPVYQRQDINSVCFPENVPYHAVYGNISQRGCAAFQPGSWFQPGRLQLDCVR